MRIISLKLKGSGYHAPRLRQLEPWLSQQQNRLVYGELYFIELIGNELERTIMRSI